MFLISRFCTMLTHNSFIPTNTFHFLAYIIQYPTIFSPYLNERYRAAAGISCHLLFAFISFIQLLWKNYPAPSTEYQALSTKHPALSTQHWAPSTKHQALSTKLWALSTISPAYNEVEPGLYQIASTKLMLIFAPEAHCRTVECRFPAGWESPK